MLHRMNAAQQQRQQPNRLERQGYAMLGAMGVRYIRQHRINARFVVDAYVPTAKLVVEFDGDYWHGNPARYPKPTSRQQRQQNWDKAQDAYMDACGIRTVRLWESEMKDDLMQCRARVCASLLEG